jgi:hypothetical protein
MLSPKRMAIIAPMSHRSKKRIIYPNAIPNAMLRTKPILILVMGEDKNEKNSTPQTLYF